jgi:hypothetical protein
VLAKLCVPEREIHDKSHRHKFFQLHTFQALNSPSSPPPLILPSSNLHNTNTYSFLFVMRNLSAKTHQHFMAAEKEVMKN